MTPRARVAVVVLAVGLVGAALAVRWLRPGADAVHEIAGPTMGTTFSVRIDADLSDAERRRARAIVERELDRVNALMSTYDSMSELSRFNRHVSTTAFAASRELVEVLAMAHSVSERSAGAFDVTVGPLVEAWGFGAGSGLDGPLEPRPGEAELARLRERVGYQNIVVDAAAGTIAKTRPDVRIDLSAIAKGYAAEVVADTLVEMGLSAVLVDVGGELRAVGTRRDGSPWRVGVERPDDAPGAFVTLTLDDEGIATSGDFRDSYEVDGVRYAHIIDPRTGRPIVGRGASVTVVHRSAALADAWATALTVLGPDEGIEVARREGLAALFLYQADGALGSRATPAMDGRVK